MSNDRVVTKALAGVEDLLLGEGVVNQTRNGTPVNITKINASNLSYNASLNIRDKLAKKPEVLNTVAEMQILDTSLEAEIYVYLLGYYEAGDGGGGLFWLDSSDTSSTQDNSLVFYPDVLLNGRWKRIDIQNQISPDNGDANIFLEAYDEGIQLFATPLTANRTVFPPTTNLFKGQTFTIIRKDKEPFVLNIFDVAGFQQTISGVITFVYDGTDWQVTADVPNIEASYSVIENVEDAYKATLGIRSYMLGVTYPITFGSNTNITRTPTIEFDNLGQTAIKNSDTSLLEIGTLPHEAFLRYSNQGDMILLNPAVANKKVCKAWLSYDGNSLILHDSFNVLGVGRNSTGNYTVSFLNDMSNVTYVVCGTARHATTLRSVSSQSKSTSSVGLLTYTPANQLGDSDTIDVAIFGE